LVQISSPDGTLSLDHLGAFSVRDAHAWLERLPGIGRKVSSAVLNFSTLQKPTLVIDTHHLRILKRLKIVDAKWNFTQTHDCVMPRLPSHWKAKDCDDHHTLMKRHGQEICRHSRPICESCPLKELCPSS
ncbi:MAG: hypothetical protein AAFN80_15080, partial [Pseudomonadota bacterium]